ncbi:hypothetical protein HPB49_005059 [Dermacentor silvarum]|uniref:Uncharacterized protein n=1 Tax=Dermacentor silvarum TaxID=543639 RepID=A0ACB8C269_DERSI|nr:hypothetical protein HPB49_005059 [Dermacentor silvarum]
MARQYLPNAFRGYVFAERHQESWESVADYVTTLRWLAGNFGVGGEEFPLTEMLRDRLAFEITDKVVQHHLLEEKQQTFEAAYELIVEAETTAMQREVALHRLEPTRNRKRRGRNA